MLYRIGSALLFLFVTLSCTQLSDNVAFQEMRRLEYSRQVDQQKFIGWLHNKNPQIRLRATEVLGRIQDSTILPVLANRLTDEDIRVRAAAAVALGQLHTTRAESYLMDALKLETENVVRSKLVEALGKCGTEKSFLTLRDFLQSSYPEYQKQSAIAHGLLARRGILPPGSNVETLGKVMRTTHDPDVAWRCAYALYRIGNVWSLPDLSAELEDSIPMAKFFALRGIDLILSRMETDQFKQFAKQNRSDKYLKDLLKLKRSRSLRKSIIACLQDSAWYVRLASLELMSGMEDEIFQKEIVKMLDDPHPQVQIAAIRALGSYKNWYTRRELRRVYKDADDWHIQGEALAVLALIQPGEALQHVKEDLLPKPWPENYYAIPTLQNIETTDPKHPVRQTDDATRLLMKLADGKNIAQTTFALDVLTNRRKPPVVDFFIDKLKSGDMAVATIVSTYFASPNGPRPEEAVPTLIHVYRTFTAPRDLEAMQEILVAIDSIGSDQAVPFLKEELNNPYPSIHEAARRAIINITGDNSITIPVTTHAYSTKWDFPPVSPDSLYQVTFFTTRGSFTIQLNPEEAPVNVANIISLVKRNFYDNIYFHRVVPGFVVQTGDPRGDGWGGSGYSVPCEYSDLFYDRGVVGIAHAGKDTGSSQFFVTHTPQPHLNGKYTVIGRVVEGMGVIDRLLMFDKILKTQLTVRANSPLAGASPTP